VYFFDTHILPYSGKNFKIFTKISNWQKKRKRMVKNGNNRQNAEKAALAII